MKLGIVADDNTGATDAAGMLTQCGARTLLACGPIRPGADLSAYDAVIIGTRSRSIDPCEAYRRVAQAARFLRAAGAEKIQLKYCSTFDSTPRGNIGQSLDAALETLGTDRAVVVPALPELGRTTYQGYHFVHSQLLSESPMRDHPLNPMTDSNLMRWLGFQTRRKVGLAPLETVRQGPAALEQWIASQINERSPYVVVDALTDQDLDVIAQATASHLFVSGGSGITAALARMLFAGRPALSFARQIAACPPGTLVISGSMSPSSRAQIALASAGGFCEVPVSAAQVVSGELSSEQVAGQAADLLRGGKNVLVHSKVDSAGDVQRTQQLGSDRGLTAVQTGELIAQFLGQVAKRLVGQAELGRLVIAGGETSSFVCDAIGASLMEVGLPLDPGVPYCFPLDLGRPLLLVLKSGNFGGRDLYPRVAGLR